MQKIVLETAAEVYREIKGRGLEIRQNEGRDNALFRELLLGLGCPDDQLMNYLTNEKVSAKTFLIAFMQVVKPFSMMFTEIWNYLSDHCAPKAIEVLSLRFGLPDEENPDDINLEQFRRFAEENKLINEVVNFTYWPTASLEFLFELGRILHSKDRSYESKRMLYYSTGQNLSLPEISISEHEMDDVINDIRNLFQKVIADANNESIPGSELSYNKRYEIEQGL